MLDVGDGTCFAVPKEGKQYVNRTRFDDGEYGIAVRWLGRLTEDPELRTFDLDAECTDEFIVNSSELRCTHIELIPHCPVGPAVRRSPRGYGGHVRDGRDYVQNGRDRDGYGHARGCVRGRAHESARHGGQSHGPRH